MLEYWRLLVFVGMSAFFALILLLLPFVINKLRPDFAKLSPYECGVEPIENSRGKFEVQFYLVAMIFVIFDLEICFLLPWTMVVRQVGLHGFLGMMAFFAIITGSLIYEWKKGAMKW